MSSQIINVHNLPRYVSEEELTGSAVVVIDVLRASTTICQALASGAREVVPFLQVDQALAAAALVKDRTEIVLGGERHGRLIPGFDLGNSPSEYTRTAVAGKRVYITTTNGTRAFEHSRLAKRVLVGAAVNLAPLVGSLKNEARVDILCAGTDGQETQEDILTAGGLVSALVGLPALQAPGTSVISQRDGLSDSAIAAGMFWSQMILKARDAGHDTKIALATQLRETQGGRNLLDIGFEQDLIDCAQINRLNVVPEFDIEMWRIHRA